MKASTCEAFHVGKTISFCLSVKLIIWLLVILVIIVIPTSKPCHQVFVSALGVEIDGCGYKSINNFCCFSSPLAS